MTSTARDAAPSQTSLARLALTALTMLGLLTVLTGGVYPLVVTEIASLAFSGEAGGSILFEDGAARGSRLIGQPFDSPKYFWGRLSATAPFPYNASASTGSNLGPTNEALANAAKARVDALRAVDHENTAPVPVDLVTSSGSGLDPHITPAAAEYQIRRVARARGVSEARVRALVAANTEGRTFGIFGEPRVNVLLLNLALDREQ